MTLPAQTAVLLLVAVQCLAQDPRQQQPPAPSGNTATQLLSPPPGDGPVVVHAAFDLQDINGIYEESETFEFSGVLTLVWRDARQTFDPAEAGVTEKIYQGEFQFNEISPAWYPQVALANVSGMYDKYATILRVRPDGTSILTETINAVAETRLNLRRYPFDRQRLEAVFEIFGFDASDVVLEAEPVPAAARWEYVHVPQWSLRDVSTSIRNLPASNAGSIAHSSSFVLRIDVRRQWFYMIRLVVFPLVLIVMLSWSVFWMDRSSLGDRLSVSFVGILTAVAYLMVVSDRLPQIAYVTLIHAFLNFSFLIMCGTVPVNLVVGACDRKGNAPLGHRIDRACRRLFPLAYAGLIASAVLISFLFF